MIMDSLNTDNRSKPLAFKRFKDFLYKYYPKFFKTFKKHPNKFDIRQFFVILYDCVPNTKYQWSIAKLLKRNFYVLLVGTSKNQTAALCCGNKKVKAFSTKKK